ncbi:MAG: hypothetical protein S4CHLAM81_13050 [Chlamydiales bacterium]|nr:hypothetical protein [Chlamydiales bacterium]MCH9636079.1 hypothetical protein [Chlamydiales bacterium]MCH9704476.1 hypothetical protein [Chlamydiota bacterium]
MKRALFLLFTGFLLAYGSFTIGAILLCDHFSPGDLFACDSYNRRFATDKSYDPAFFQQPYFYMGKGSQSYVFVSEDGNYVIKFFRKKRLTPTTLCSGPTFMQEIYYEARRKKMKERWDLFASCHLAYMRLRSECGLLYMHLNPSDDLGSLLIHDALKRKRSIDLNQYSFFVQKRAEPLLARFAPQDVAQIPHLLKKRFDKGIDDHDPVLQKNMGFVGSEPIFIDIGAFYPNPTVKKGQYQNAYQMTRKLGRWLDQKQEGLSEELDSALKIVL